jgi:hypothetical protein
MEASRMLTYEQRQKGGRTAVAKMTRKQLQEAGRKGCYAGAAIVSALRVECPHGCGLTSTPGAIGNHVKVCRA